MKNGTNPHNVYDVSHSSRLQNVGGDRWVSVPVFQQKNIRGLSPNYFPVIPSISDGAWNAAQAAGLFALNYFRRDRLDRSHQGPWIFHIGERQLRKKLLLQMNLYVADVEETIKNPTHET